jgi:hypothetical protein
MMAGMAETIVRLDLSLKISSRIVVLDITLFLLIIDIHNGMDSNNFNLRFTFNVTHNVSYDNRPNKLGTISPSLMTNNLSAIHFFSGIC